MFMDKWDRLRFKEENMGMKMTMRQKLLKMVYPLFIFYEKIKGKRTVLYNEKEISAPESFYSLSAELSSGPVINFEKFRGRKVMIVNTASDCGYTAQYAELQKLYQHSKEDLDIIAFPSNDFGDQDNRKDEEVREFCINIYSIRFLIAKKSVVKRSAAQHPVFRWLTQKEMNGWNEKPPSWNFSKYIIDEEGRLTHYFDPSISPVSEEVIKAIHQ